MTDLEQASIDYKRIQELHAEIQQCREFQISCKKANDNIGDKAWKNRIKELGYEIQALDGKSKYIKFSLFTQTVKAYLTPDQYKECWARVDEILENPSLMQ